MIGGFIEVFLKGEIGFEKVFHFVPWISKYVPVGKAIKNAQTLRGYHLKEYFSKKNLNTKK